MVDIEKLKKFKIFKDLNQRELELIANIAEYEAYEAGKRIFEEKALATTLYLTLEGKIEIKLGEIFGWSAVTEPYTFTAAAWTLEKTKFITFSGERLKDLFDKNNHIGYRVVKEIAVVISRRLKAMESKFVVTLRMKK
ncbi:hypothetical protein ES703_119537 [subsurface metagenome]